MKKIFPITILVILLSLPINSVFAGGLQQAVIHFEKIDWQTYKFFAKTDVEDEQVKSYHWAIDGKDFFTQPQIQYTFDSGEHDIDLVVEDIDGNKRIAQVTLSVSFWSFGNPQLLLLLYGFLGLMIVYYWLTKLIYLVNRKKIDRQTQLFMQVFDEHGWVEQLVAQMVEKKEKE